MSLQHCESLSSAEDTSMAVLVKQSKMMGFLCCIMGRFLLFLRLLFFSDFSFIRFAFSSFLFLNQGTSQPTTSSENDSVNQSINQFLWHVSFSLMMSWQNDWWCVIREASIDNLACNVFGGHSAITLGMLVGMIVGSSPERELEVDTESTPQLDSTRLPRTVTSELPRFSSAAFSGATWLYCTEEKQPTKPLEPATATLSSRTSVPVVVVVWRVQTC